MTLESGLTRRPTMRLTCTRVVVRRAVATSSLLIASVLLLVSQTVVTREVGPGAEPRNATRPGVVAALAKLPLSFIENRGQLDTRVRYYVQGRETTVHFTAAGLTLSLGAGADQRRSVLKLDFIGANPDVALTGQDRAPGVVSYFKGPRAQWKTGVPTYTRVVYSELWPGIDLEYSGTVDKIKYDFVVKPGADPNRIRLVYRGATRVRLREGGQLEVVTPTGSLEDDKPESYQDVEGHRVDVATTFALKARGDQYEYGFHVGAYDKTKPLVIDPALFFSGFIGGSGSDMGRGVAVDSAGNAYVTGYTESTGISFPQNVGPDLDHHHGGGGDAFVAKVTPTGTLVYCGYIGGSGAEAGFGIAVDSSGNAYVTGVTTSTEATFPVQNVGADLDHHHGGNGDAFVAKVNATGTALIYAGYIGGSGSEFDFAGGIAVDASGNAFVAGSTDSSDLTASVLVGPDLTYNEGGDAFVAKVDASGAFLSYAGYIGGGGLDRGHGIAVDSSGNAYVSGYTESSEVISPGYSPFPAQVGPDLTYNGGGDAFVAKVNASGTFEYAGYIGGSNSELSQFSGIAVDSSGHAYVTGHTESNNLIPLQIVGPLGTYNLGGDAFVVKVDATGASLERAAYIGGSGGEYGTGVAVDYLDNAYVVGGTTSNETSFPAYSGPDLIYDGGPGDAFVAKVNADFMAFSYAGYVGGSGQEMGFGIAVFGDNAFITGYSTGANFPLWQGPGGYKGGMNDAFVARIAPASVVDVLGGNFVDDCWPNCPPPWSQFLVGPDIFQTPVNLFIDAIAAPRVSTPLGYVGPSTVFVDFTLLPDPSPLRAPGATIVLPLLKPLAEGTRLELFEYDSSRGSLVSRRTTGVVDRGGRTVTFSGITQFSTFVGYQARGGR
jgi:hypothetical protein